MYLDTVKKKAEDENFRNKSDPQTTPESKDSYTDTWQYIGDESLRQKVFSAYFDDRKDAFGMDFTQFETDKNPPEVEILGKNYINGTKVAYIIHVITILPVTREIFLRGNLTCHFTYKNGTHSKTPTSNVVIHPERLRTTFVVTFLACPVFSHEEAERPEYVGITLTEENLNNKVKIQ